MRNVKIEWTLLLFISMLIGIMVFWPFFDHPYFVDFHIHDTYLIVGPMPILIFFLTYSCLLFVMYSFLRRRYGQVHALLASFHVIVTCLFSTFIIFGNQLLMRHTHGHPRRYLIYTPDDVSSFLWWLISYQRMFEILLLLFLIAQLIF